MGPLDEGGGRASDARLAWVALALLVPVPTVAVLCAMWWDLGVVGQAVWGASKAVQVLFPVVWWVWVLKRRPRVSRPMPGQVAVGAGVGLGIAGLIIGGYLVLGPALFDDAARTGFKAKAAENGLDQRWKFLAFAASLSLFNSLMEEYLWRWFVGTRCEVVTGSTRWAVPLCAALFTLHHILALAPQFGVLLTVLTSLGVFIGGFVWSVMYARYRSVWPSYVSHLIVNVGMFVPAYWLLFG